MDQALTGTLILLLAFLPWVVEVVVQLRLQARFLGALSESKRAALPPHPRRPWLAFLASPRFAWAMWRAFRRDQPDDQTAVLALKRRMRASFRRELVWGPGFVTVLVVLIATGWRPIWP
jgi:hypothetical protein